MVMVVVLGLLADTATVVGVVAVVIGAATATHARPNDFYSSWEAFRFGLLHNKYSRPVFVCKVLLFDQYFNVAECTRPEI